jgi:hypothetical protein
MFQFQFLQRCGWRTHLLVDDEPYTRVVFGIHNLHSASRYNNTCARVNGRTVKVRAALIGLKAHAISALHFNRVKATALIQFKLTALVD